MLRKSDKIVNALIVTVMELSHTCLNKSLEKEDTALKAITDAWIVPMLSWKFHQSSRTFLEALISAPHLSTLTWRSVPMATKRSFLKEIQRKVGSTPAGIAKKNIFMITSMELESARKVKVLFVLDVWVLKFLHLLSFKT